MAKFSEIQLRDTCGDLKARKIIKVKCGRYSYARILGFHTEDGKDFAFCQCVTAKLKVTGKCGWFSIDVTTIKN